MGAGRKTGTSRFEGKSQTGSKDSYAMKARNLRKSELGAVIFGCKHHTFEECLSNRLFGLPAAHYSYVKNVSPGLTLFLFNYSDRRLHGIFEAEGPGQMNINPYGWTYDGEESTPYGAQVRVRVRRKCQPLVEEQFKPIIAANYYEDRLFWFELDKEQTSKLIKLFSSSRTRSDFPPKSTSMSNNIPPKSTSKSKNMFATLSVFDEPNDKTENEVPEKMLERPDQIIGHCEPSHISALGTIHLDLKEDHRQSYASLLTNTDTSSPKKKCSELLKNWSACDLLKNEETVQKPAVSLIPSIAVESYIEQDVACGSPSQGGNKLCSEVCPTDHNTAWDSCPEDREERASMEINTKEVSLDNFRGGSNQHSLTDWTCSEERDCMDGVAGGSGTKMNCSNLKTVVIKLMQEVESLKETQTKQLAKVSFLEQELVKSTVEIQKLKSQLSMSESKPSRCLVFGGFDGHSWYPVLSSYIPSHGLVETLCPMTFIRSYASAVKLNCELYVIGGVHDSVWYDTVESYNPLSNQWVKQPSLNQKKGGLAAVSLNDKIFAIGGGNGAECFSEVEVFEPGTGKWILTPSMQLKRFSTAAANINNMLYVAGGFDGNDYLRSVERLDPRENKWNIVGNMRTKRGCHSLVALDEKLYAVGGYDGERMVSTVEVFDPRIGSWMMAEPMNKPRGYSGTVMIKEKIYAIGGVGDGSQIHDTVECYEEGLGWRVMESKALGKRCFFTAVVL